ncbi:MAG: hypothetical protein HW414_1432 [Dehalococcoidia bacterium]|nr:hypothetical protein [Dehalococcoidia bacterium]
MDSMAAQSGKPLPQSPEGVGNGLSQIDSPLPLEFYTQSRVFNGQVSCPSGSRFSDLLNGASMGPRSISGDFMGFVDSSEARYTDSSGGWKVVHIRKSAIQFVALSDADAGKCNAGSGSQTAPPFVTKSTVRVSLELPTYTVAGNIHCGPGETVQDVLNDSRSFLALTDVTITREDRLYGTRPFVIVSSREELFG